MEKKSKKVACKNCGLLTIFSDVADYKRENLGWCGPCYQQSLHSKVNKETGENLWLDDDDTEREKTRERWGLK